MPHAGPGRWRCALTAAAVAMAIDEINGIDERWPRPEVLAPEYVREAHTSLEERYEAQAPAEAEAAGKY